MKRTNLILALAFLCGMANAQTQQGIVKTRGRLAANGTLIPGAPLMGATVSIKNASSYVTNDNGKFSFSIPSKTFYFTGVKKQGYLLCDHDMLNRVYQYSSDTLFVVMETPDNITADRLAAEKKLRRTLQHQLQEKEDEIEAMKEQMTISEKQYHELLQDLYDKQSKNEDLIAEMAERYATLDFDEMDEFRQKVAFFIQNGELTRADSLLDTKGNMEERSAELDRMDAAIKADSEELAKRQEAHDKSIELKAKALEDFAADCFSRFEICKMQYENDSAAYWLELRASKDTLNIDWLTYCGMFISEYLADYELAQKYIQRVIDITENDPKYSDEMRGECYSHLANIHLMSGKYDEGIRLYEKSRDLLSKDSKAYIIATGGLANCLINISKDEEAISLMREAYSLYQQYNHNDPELLFRLYDLLGACLDNNGEYDEGQQFLDLAVDLAETEEMNPSYQFLAYLESASLYRNLDNYDKAENLLKKALETGLQIYDEEHPQISAVYEEFGRLYFKQSKYQDALYYTTKAKDYLEGYDNLKYAQRCAIIAKIYADMGDMQQAENYTMESYNIKLKTYGEDNPVMIDAYNSLGSFYCDKGDFDKALVYIEKSISLRKSESGDMHPTLIISYSYMGGINMRLGQYEEGLKWFLLTLDITKHYYGEEHSKTADAYANVGGIYMYSGKYEEAINMLEKALHIHATVYGEKQADVASDYNGLGQIYMTMGKYQEAIANFQKAIEIREKVFGENNAKLKSLYEFMIQIYQRMEDTENVELYETLLNEIQE